MKKGEIYEGTIEKVDFPNKGTVMIGDQKVTVKNGIPGQKDVCWKFWRNLLRKPETLPVPFFRNVAAVCTRPCPMKNS